MKLRYPDKPNKMFKDSLPKLEKHGWWIATQKMDGWRCLLTRDSTGKLIEDFGDRSWARCKSGDVYFLSRRDLDSGGPTNFPVCDEIVQAAEALEIPDQSMLDMEWMKRRTIGECSERLYGIGPLWWDDKWLGRQTYEQRRNFIDEIISGKLNGDDPIQIPDHVSSGFEDFYEKQTEIPFTEGMVLARKDSKVVGDRSGCRVNKSLIKIKWRDGADGRDVYVDPR